MARLYLVRHAVHDLVDKTLAGRLPGVRLGPEGHAQAARLAEAFATRPLRAIRVSPLERCHETAAPVAARLGLTIAADEALNEIACGAWTGVSFAELRADPAWAAWNGERGMAGTPGGETIASVRRRVMRLVDHLARADDGPTMLVTHGDVVKVVVQSLLGANLDWHDRLAIDPASITTVDLWPGGGKIVRMNEVVGA